MPAFLSWKPNRVGPALLPAFGRTGMGQIHRCVRCFYAGPHGSSPNIGRPGASSAGLHRPLPRRIARPDVPFRSAAEVRASFLDFFQARSHTRVTPVPIVPAHREEGTYFVNSGMMQFKPVFLGTCDPNSALGQLRRATNSQRCARIGGKHNDLDDVGRDGTHLTLFEMLGSWSFGDYRREEACSMAWEYLTKVLQLPADDLYVTYFGGDKELGLPVDVRTRDIWLKIGVNEKRLLPFGKAHNFWEMANTGPCGPCTEIHFDHIGGGRCARGLVNEDSPEVVEVWNLVFMEFERLPTKGLRPLPCLHVDTGMGLERLAGIVQGVTSAFDTDLFEALLAKLNDLSGLGRSYGGLFEVGEGGSAEEVRQDIAYRIVADHLRLFGVSLADGLLPAKNGLGLKMRNVLQRTLRHAIDQLQMAPESLAEVVPTLVEALEPIRPGMNDYQEQIRHVLLVEEKDFRPRLKAFNVAFEEVLGNRRASSGDRTNVLTEHEVMTLVRRESGAGMSYDLARAFCADHGFGMPDLGLTTGQAVLDDEGMVTARLPLYQDDASLLALLQELNLPDTEVESVHDYFKNRKGKYEFPVQDAQILAIVGPDGLLERVEDGTECALILSSTSFYAEAGGQLWDEGHVTSNLSRHLPQRLFQVRRVRKLRGFVVHEGCALNGAALEPKRHVHLQVCADRRLGLMRHHTGTHVFNFVLRDLFGLGRVKQGRSVVRPDSAVFGFTCVNPCLLDQIELLEDHARQMIRSGLPVHRYTIPLEKATANPHILTLDGKAYPSQVHLICMGDNYDALERFAAGCPSVLPADSSPLVCAELCCGTHVQNTADLIDLVVLSLRGGNSYFKEAEVLVGQAALEVRARGEDLRQDTAELVRLVERGLERKNWASRLKAIETVLGQEVLPKVAREKVVKMLDQCRPAISTYEKEAVKKDHKAAAQKAIVAALADAGGKTDPVVVSITIRSVSQTVKAVREVGPPCPVLLTDSRRLICFVPDTLAPLTAFDLAQRLCDVVNSSGICIDDPLVCHEGIGLISKFYSIIFGGGNLLSHPDRLQSFASRCM